MATTEFIAAIEIGSSHIAGMTGRKQSDGSLQVLAYASEPSSAFVRKGVVNNIDKTARALRSIVNRLEAESGAAIDKLYVGISGQPLRTVRNSVSRQLDGEQIISVELVDAICDENRGCYPTGGDIEVLDVVPQEYKIDNQLQADPISVPGRNITGQFLNLVARTMLKERLERSFQQAGLQMADDPLIAPLALAGAVLSEGEMRSGCVLVDFGADTTTVQVYKENILRHLAVIPLGGNSLTRDITSLQMEEQDAEYLKRRFASACYEEPKETPGEGDKKSEAEPEAELPDGRKVSLPLLCDIAGARMDEILANVNRQIILSGQDVNRLFAGAILTGGGAALQGVAEAFRRQCHMTRVKCVQDVRIPLQGNVELLKGEENRMPCTLLGLVMAGRDNCCRPQPEPQPEPQPKPQPEPQPQETPAPSADPTGHTADIFQDDPDAQPQTQKDESRKPEAKPQRGHQPGDGHGGRGGTSEGRSGTKSGSLFGAFWDRMSKELFSNDQDMKN